MERTIHSTTNAHTVIKDLDAMRDANAVLMKHNLMVLMDIRELDSEIHRLWYKFQRRISAIEKAEINKPQSCITLIQEAQTTETESSDQVMEDSTIGHLHTQQHEENQVNIDIPAKDKVPRNSTLHSILN